MEKKRIGLLGATAYTGAELLRMLERHPMMELDFIASDRLAGEPLLAAFPELVGTEAGNLLFIGMEEAVERKVDGIFSCLPHQVAAELLLPFIDRGEAVVVDLSADFRLKELRLYEEYYCPHPRPSLLQESVYGLCELSREEIRGKKLIANPGCYPTSVLLPLIPLLRKGLISPKGIISDSKSGVTGAGKKATETTHFVNVHDDFFAYKVADEHRHLSEIREQLSFAAEEKVSILFTPYLLPIARGILTTSYADLMPGVDETAIRAALLEVYGNEPFVTLMEKGFPKTSWVRGNNRCIFGLKVSGNKLIVISAIDNLVKGASGQALQNMNIALGLDETLGLW